MSPFNWKAGKILGSAPSSAAFGLVRLSHFPVPFPTL